MYEAFRARWIEAINVETCGKNLISLKNLKTLNTLSARKTFKFSMLLVKKIAAIEGIEMIIKTKSSLFHGSEI